MKIINLQTNGLSYPPLMDWDLPSVPTGWATFPDELYDVFYPADKECAGFVNITLDEAGTTVTACEWNEEAYQEYIANLPEPEEEVDEFAELQEQVAVLKEQLAETDEAAIELYEANLAQEAINAEQDEAIIEIYEMMEASNNG